MCGIETKEVVLCLVMAVAGSLNSLTLNWANKQQSMGTERPHAFVHVSFQVLVMFVGETTCLLIYYIRQWYRKKYAESPREPCQFNPFIFMPGSIMDMISTFLILFGLVLTDSFSYQFLRASSIIFTAILAKAFLHRSFTINMIIGICIITFDGFIIVGLSDLYFGDRRQIVLNSRITGDLLIVIGQIVLAVQEVYREYCLTKYDVSPMIAVGLEGIFGLTIWGILQIPFSYMYGGMFFMSNPRHRIEDYGDVFTQMSNNHIIIIAIIAFFFTVIVYNYFMMRVIKLFGATSFTVLNSLNIILYWVFSLVFQWQSFHYVKFIGLVLTLFGVLCYFNITVIPLVQKYILHRSASSVKDYFKADQSKPLLSPLGSL